MKTKLRKRILRNLKMAKETLDSMIETLELEEAEEKETGFEYLVGFKYIYQTTRAAIGDLTIVQDLVKDELREN
jgi:hypothetical protein